MSRAAPRRVVLKPPSDPGLWAFRPRLGAADPPLFEFRAVGLGFQNPLARAMRRRAAGLDPVALGVARAAGAAGCVRASEIARLARPGPVARGGQFFLAASRSREVCALFNEKESYFFTKK